MINHLYQSYNSRDRTNTDSRRLTLGFAYNWGKTKIKVPNRKPGNEVVIKRFWQGRKSQCLLNRLIVIINQTTSILKKILDPRLSDT